MTVSALKVLLLGYGNPGRQDDGLGPAVAEFFEKRNIPGVTVDADYQLTVEDAAAMAGHEVVIFADASVTGPEPFEFKPVVPNESGGWTTHSISPEALLEVAQSLFHANTRGYVLAIRGYEFKPFEEEMTAMAQKNFQAAVRFLEPLLIHKDFSWVEGEATLNSEVKNERRKKNNFGDR
jgi:hydrogenase maturation protease